MIYENINELKIRTHGEIYKPYSVPTKFVTDKIIKIIIPSPNKIRTRDKLLKSYSVGTKIRIHVRSSNSSSSRTAKKIGLRINYKYHRESEQKLGITINIGKST